MSPVGEVSPADELGTQGIDNTTLPTQRHKRRVVLGVAGVVVVAVVAGAFLLMTRGYTFPGTGDLDMSITEQYYLRAFTESYTDDPGRPLGVPGVTAEEMIALGYLACAQTNSGFQDIAGRSRDTGLLPLHNLGARTIWGVAHASPGFVRDLEYLEAFTLCDNTFTKSLTDRQLVRILEGLRSRF